MCLYNEYMINKKYTHTAKNMGNIPEILDSRVKYVPIGCGRCIECKKKKAREWQIRLLEDIKENKNGKFVTLTFSDESIAKLSETEKLINIKGYEHDNAIARIAVRRFLERWRKKHKKSVRHWLVTELGHEGTENIHLHGIIFTDMVEEIERHWKYGFVWKGHEVNGKIINYVGEATVNYIIKYVNKVDEEHSYYNSVVLTSPGIGKNYLTSWDFVQNQFKGKETKDTYRLPNGSRAPLPPYYRNHRYTEEERELLWLMKLDEEKRYVLGEKVDISKSEEDYFNVREYYRKINQKMGYGSNKVNYIDKEYQNQVRDILRITRVKKGLKRTWEDINSHLGDAGQEPGRRPNTQR